MLILLWKSIDPLQESLDKFSELEGSIVVWFFVIGQARVKATVLNLSKVYTLVKHWMHLR